MCAIGSTKQSRSSPPSVNWLDFLLQFVIFPLFLNRSKRLIVLFAYTCAWISFYPSPSMSYYLEEGWSRMPLLSHTLSESGSFLQMKWEDKPSREKKKAERETDETIVWAVLPLFTPVVSSTLHISGTSPARAAWLQVHRGRVLRQDQRRVSVPAGPVPQVGLQPACLPTVNNTGFLERIGRGSSFCFVPFS